MIASSTNQPQRDIPPVHLVGSGSRLFRDLGWPGDVTKISGRADDLAAMPAFPQNASILIFADPPSEAETRAMILSVLGRLDARAPTRIIYISSISAGFRDSLHFPHEGPYARRKRIAEEMLFRSELAQVTVLRLGNIFSHGGWQSIREDCRLAILPRGARYTAQSDAASLLSELELSLAGQERGDVVMEAFSLVETANVLPRVVFVPGLLGFYRNGALRLALKILAKILRKIGIYLPSPDDLNAFLMTKDDIIR